MGSKATDATCAMMNQAVVPAKLNLQWHSWRAYGETVLLLPLEHHEYIAW